MTLSEMPTIPVDREDEFFKRVMLRQLEELRDFSSRINKIAGVVHATLALGGVADEEELSELESMIDQLNSALGGDLEGDLWFEVANALIEEDAEEVPEEHTPQEREQLLGSTVPPPETRAKEPNRSEALFDRSSAKSLSEGRPAENQTTSRDRWPRSVKTRNLDEKLRLSLLDKAHTIAKAQVANEYRGFSRRKEATLREIEEARARISSENAWAIFKSNFDARLDELATQQENFDSGSREKRIFESELDRLCREAAQTNSRAPKRNPQTKKSSGSTAQEKSGRSKQKKKRKSTRSNAASSGGGNPRPVSRVSLAELATRVEIATGRVAPVRLTGNKLREVPNYGNPRSRVRMWSGKFQ